MKQNSIKLGLAVIIIFSGNWIIPLNESIAQVNCEKCNVWQAKVDPNIKLTQNSEMSNKTSQESELSVVLSKNPVFSELSDNEVFEGIECLLKLEGKKHDSKISGATNFDVSQTFGATKVEVAGLYYISYLFFQNWGHADAAVLVDEKGKFNTNESVSKAYESYKKWFSKLKEVGLEEARKQKLNPLAGSGVRWY